MTLLRTASNPQVGIEIIVTHVPLGASRPCTVKTTTAEAAGVQLQPLRPNPNTGAVIIRIGFGAFGVYCTIVLHF